MKRQGTLVHTSGAEGYRFAPCRAHHRINNLDGSADWTAFAGTHRGLGAAQPGDSWGPWPRPKAVWCPRRLPLG